MATVGAGNELFAVSFGHSSPLAALAALDLDGYELAETSSNCWNPALAHQLERYAAGQRVDFRRVKLSSDGMSDFEQRVIAACRAIPYGQTRTYGEVAAAAGAPRAARAVGSIMRKCRVPLVVPCHRVVSASGVVRSHCEQVREKLRRLEGERRT